MYPPDFTKTRFNSRPFFTHLRPLAITTVLTLASGCTPSDIPEAHAPGGAPARLAFETHTLHEERGTCEDPQGACVRVTLHYLEAVDGPAAARAAVNTFQADFLTGQLREFQPGDSSQRVGLEALVQGFIDAYNAVLAELPGTPQRWTFETTAEVVYNTPFVSTLKFGLDTYTGGAHPNFLTVYASFDVATGDRLTVEDLVRDVDALRERVEQAFRTAHNLTPGADLSEAGFFFEGGTFSLPSNIGVTDAGLVFYYNPYEVAPYAVGPTELRLPLASVRDLLVDPRLSAPA